MRRQILKAALEPTLESGQNPSIMLKKKTSRLLIELRNSFEPVVIPSADICILSFGERPSKVLAHGAIRRSKRPDDHPFGICMRLLSQRPHGGNRKSNVMEQSD